MLLPFYAGATLEHFCEHVYWLRRNATVSSFTKTMSVARDKLVQKMLERVLEGIQNGSTSRELDKQQYWSCNYEISLLASIMPYFTLLVVRFMCLMTSDVSRSIEHTV